MNNVTNLHRYQTEQQFRDVRETVRKALQDLEELSRSNLEFYRMTVYTDHTLHLVVRQLNETAHAMTDLNELLDSVMRRGDQELRNTDQRPEEERLQGHLNQVWKEIQDMDFGGGDDE